MATYVLFSPVSGTVTMNGAPVVGARVERTYQWRWGKQNGSDEAVTDDKGKFRLGVITGSSMTAWLPHEAFVVQVINVYYKGETHKVWGCDKRDYNLNSELEGREIAPNFQLELEKQRINRGCVGKFVLN